MATTAGHDDVAAGHGDSKQSSTVQAVTQQGSEALKDIAFGSVAGAIGKIIEYPFDTVKVRLQSQPDGAPLKYAGPLDCFQQAVRKDGFFGIYRGVSAPLVGAAVENSCLFLSYNLAQRAVRASYDFDSSQPLPMPWLLVCGGASGAFTSFALTPIELVKCRMQTSAETGKKPGVLTVVNSVYQHGGIMGFWHGQLGTLIRETGGSAAWFGSYESVTTFFKGLRAASLVGSTSSQDPGPLPIWQQLLAGASAGMSYNFLFYPADTIKSRMQTEEMSDGGSRKTFGSIARTIWKEHGLKGLYRGCGITVARAAPSSAVIFTVYETLKAHFA